MPSRRKVHKKKHSRKSSKKKFLNFGSLLKLVQSPESRLVARSIGVPDSVSDIIPMLTSLTERAPETMNILKLIVTQNFTEIPDILEILKLYSSNLAAKQIIKMMINNPSGIYKMSDVLSNSLVATGSQGNRLGAQPGSIGNLNSQLFSNV
jgi:hypothetical protein